MAEYAGFVKWSPRWVWGQPSSAVLMMSHGAEHFSLWYLDSLAEQSSPANTAPMRSPVVRCHHVTFQVSTQKRTIGYSSTFLFVQLKRGKPKKQWKKSYRITGTHPSAIQAAFSVPGDFSRKVRPCINQA